MGQRHGPAGVVPLVHAVRGRGLVLPADGLVRAAGDGVGQGGGRRRVGRVVPGGELRPRGLRHAAAAEGGDAAAVAARKDGRVGDQAGGVALGGRRGEGRHCGLGKREKEDLSEGFRGHAHLPTSNYPTKCFSKPADALFDPPPWLHPDGQL